MDILVVLENRNGALHRMSLEAIAAAQALARDLNLTVAALVWGPQAQNLAREAATKKVDEVLALEHELLEKYSSDGYAEALKQVIEQETPRYVLVGHTYMVRDYFPKVSARIRKPFIGDVVAYRVEDGAPVFTRQVFNAKLVVDVVPQVDPPVLVSFQSATFQADAVEAGAAPVREITVALEAEQIKTQSEPPFQEAAGDVDLSSAEVIVSVGRGIGKEENIPVAEELAKAMGAELGSSRPVVDAGWLPSSRQVGSSGQSVAPKLYLALGISGAIQHVVGMKGSKNVVAINKDPEAPIFEIADYGIVGDLLEIVPKLTEAIKEQS
ncbi:MAG: electron transfer flavoprotein subunit alpha/FixB family protein [FCB group bacterium]|nr:electron transfer flavoprotein subunit alpha/FixB family protein [FCB group bacterium]